VFGQTTGEVIWVVSSTRPPRMAKIVRINIMAVPTGNIRIPGDLLVTYEFWDWPAFPGSSQIAV
jgi:hypothetical protein